MSRLLNTLTRIIKYTLQHLSRNLWQSLLVVLMLSLTFLFGQILTLLSLTSDQVLKYFENQPQVTVFFKDTASSEQITQIRDELVKDSRVESVDYISKEQAVEIYRERHKEEPELLEFVTPDILPASLQISVNQVSYLSIIAAQFERNQFVEKVLYQQDLVKEITNLTKAFRSAGFILVLILAFVSAMIILIVIADSVRAFSREIEIMRLVGAGTGYIRWPFLIDGVLFALISTLVATLVTVWLIPQIQGFVNNFIAPIGPLSWGFWHWAELILPNSILDSSVYLSLILNLGLGTFLVGSCFTVLISYIAVSKHLRV